MTERTKADVGAIVKARRLELRMTPAQVVQTAKVDPKTYASLEDGTRWPQERTRLRVEAALKWKSGSIDEILAGGEPVNAEPAASTLITTADGPSVTVNLDRNGGDLVATLTEVLESGPLPPGAQAQLESLRDDALIERFPRVFDALTRGGKLRVAHYGQEVQQEEQEQGNDMETETPAGTSTEASKNEEDSGLDDPQAGKPLRKHGLRKAAVVRGQE